MKKFGEISQKIYAQAQAAQQAQGADAGSNPEDEEFKVVDEDK